MLDLMYLVPSGFDVRYSKPLPSIVLCRVAITPILIQRRYALDMGIECNLRLSIPTRHTPQNEPREYETWMAMSWNLTEEEQAQLMDVIEQVTKPYFGRIKSSVICEGRPMTIYPVRIKPDTPDDMRALAEIYENIIAKGAFAVDPDEIT